MIKYFVLGFCILISCCLSLFQNGLIGTGRWLVVHIEKCPDDDNYLFRFDLNRRKVNRTHDGFSGWMELDRDLDETFGVRVETCIHVDGGCKPYHVLTDDNVCHFMEKYAKENVEKCFIASGIPLPICPVPKGRHEIATYVYNYAELPEQGVYGLFGAREYMMLNDQKVACIDMTVKFDAYDDE